MIIVPPGRARRGRPRGNPLVGIVTGLAAASLGIFNAGIHAGSFKSVRASANWPWYLAGGGLLLALAVAFVVVLVVRGRDAQRVDAEGGDSSGDDSCGVDPRRRLVLVALALGAFVLAGAIAYGHRR